MSIEASEGAQRILGDLYLIRKYNYSFIYIFIKLI